MEERVGLLWHKFATHLADKGYPDAGVELSSIARTLAIIFRALGGNPGLKVQSGAATKHGARRTLLQKIAGTQQKIDMAWVDHEALRLPPSLKIYPERQLNRNLYFWLTALCACERQRSLPWLARNQMVTLEIIDKFPGLNKDYSALVEAEISRRPSPQHLPADEAAQERAIQEALRRPGTVMLLPPSRVPPEPVLLWTRPDIIGAAPVTPAPNFPPQPSAEGQSSAQQEDKRRRTAEHTQLPSRDDALLLFRPETILSLTEYAKTEHEISENENDLLSRFADDLDMISVVRDGKNIAKKLRMDLDIVTANDTAVALEGEKLLPEWNYHTQCMVPDQCRIKVVPIKVIDAAPNFIPDHLQQPLRQLTRSFSALNPHRTRLKSQPDGNELDIDEYIRHYTSKENTDPYVYLDYRRRERDIASLLLADISLSTEAWIGDNRRVIDVIRDSMFLFSSSLSESKDPFCLYGFSSVHRTDVRLYTIKAFDESYTGTVRRRINSIEPTAYTRMGAAIRQAAEILSRWPARDHLLILLTDGKPNDTDHYEGRYGVEDTRMALHEARKLGLRVFCVTIDQEAHEYLPYIFGKNNFTIIRNPADLPTRLTLLYRQITQC